MNTKIENKKVTAEEFVGLKGITRELDTIADLQQLTDVPNRVLVSGYHTKGDGAFESNIHEWDATSTETHNGGTVFNPNAPFPTDWNDSTQVDAWYNFSDTSVGRYKLRFGGSVNAEFFGVFGNGISDDTAAIQKALNDTTTKLIGRGSYLVDGGLVVNRSNIIIDFTGATIKLKDNSSNGYIIKTTYDNVTFLGGTFDGNKQGGNTVVSTYDSFCIGIFGKHNKVLNTICKDSYGIAIKGDSATEYALIENNKISGTTHYGIFITSSGADKYGNKAKHNDIDMSDGGILGQGILFTSASGYDQIDWELYNNNIVGSKDISIVDQAINLAVRGRKGKVIGNTTKYGAMGFSEGGADTIVSNNTFTDLVGSVQIGIEPSGRQVISNNIVNGCRYGVQASGTNYEGMVVSSNIITTHNSTSGSTHAGIDIRSTNAEYISISGNTIDCSITGTPIILAKNTRGTSVTNNILTGISDSAHKCIFIDTPTNTDLKLSIIGNNFKNYFSPWSFYSGTAIEVTDIYCANNYTPEGNRSNILMTEGSLTIGTRCKIIGNSYYDFDLLDANKKIFNSSTNTVNDPNGAITAGIGSIHRSTNQNGGIWYKVADDGLDTGWHSL